MNTLTAVFLATFLLINTFFHSYQESPELKEASTLTESVAKLFEEGKYGEALPLAKRALQIREKLLPRNDPQILISLTYLGDLYIVKKDYRAAEQILDRLLHLQVERSSPDDASIASTMDRLAVVYYRQGLEHEAEDVFKRALAAREKAFGPESLRVAQSLFALGEFYRGEKDFERAASSYKRSLAIHGKLSGIFTPEFERASDSFTCLAYESKKLDIVKDLNEIRKQFGPPQAPAESVETRILDGTALKLGRPEYPPEARDRRLSGFVVVKLEIDETGRVTGASDMCQGPPYLSESAVKAAMQSRFTPTKLSGMPVKVKGVIKYNFVRLP